MSGARRTEKAHGVSSAERTRNASHARLSPREKAAWDAIHRQIEELYTKRKAEYESEQAKFPRAFLEIFVTPNKGICKNSLGPIPTSDAVKWDRDFRDRAWAKGAEPFPEKDECVLKVAKEGHGRIDIGIARDALEIMVSVHGIAPGALTLEFVRLRPVFLVFPDVRFFPLDEIAWETFARAYAAFALMKSGQFDPLSQSAVRYSISKRYSHVAAYAIVKDIEARLGDWRLSSGQDLFAFFQLWKNHDQKADGFAEYANRIHSGFLERTNESPSKPTQGGKVPNATQASQEGHGKGDTWDRTEPDIDAVVKQIEERRKQNPPQSLRRIADEIRLTPRQAIFLKQPGDLSISWHRIAYLRRKFRIP